MRFPAFTWLPTQSTAPPPHDTNALRPSPPSSSSPAPLSYDTSSASSSGSLTVPFFTVSGFTECGWYRRALCIAEDFLSRAPPVPSPSSAADVSGPPVRIEAVTLPRNAYRHYLLHLMQDEQIDLRDHFSCPIIIEGHCTITDSGDDSAAQGAPSGESAASAASVAAGVSSAAASTGSSGVSCVCRADRLVGGFSEWERLLRERYGFVSQRCGRVPSHTGAGC